MTALGDRLTIRPAERRDVGRVVEIYNAGIAERVATFETAPRTVEDLSSWVADGQPFIVAIDNDKVVGWARAGAYSDRCIYQGVGEHDVYVHPSARGRALLTELCAESERRGLYKLTSRVFTDNEPSRAAHGACARRDRGQPPSRRADDRPHGGRWERDRRRCQRVQPGREPGA